MYCPYCGSEERQQHVRTVRTQTREDHDEYRCTNCVRTYWRDPIYEHAPDESATNRVAGMIRTGVPPAVSR